MAERSGRQRRRVDASADGIRVQSGMRAAHRVRAALVALAVTTAFVGVGARLTALQALQHEPLLAEANRTRRLVRETRARRGHILDRNGHALAVSGTAKSLCCDPSMVPPDQAMEIAAILSRELGVDRALLEKRLTGDRRFAYMKRRLSPDEAERVAALELPGFYFEDEPVRLYPQSGALAHVLGFVDHRQCGVEGIELAEETALRGLGGWTVGERDNLHREILPNRGAHVEARNGCSVVLTIDEVIQHIVESELDRGMEEHGPIAGTVIVMDPRTGEILALANRPSFDPNNPGDAPADARRNRAITDRYEPGSTFKVIVMAAALNEGMVRLDQQFDCENGYFLYNRRVLHDHHSYGMLTAEDILVRSSNIGAAKVALRIGSQRLHDYIRRFGFGERTGLGLAGEASGTVRPVNRWSAISITRIPMGHEIDVTPLQMVRAMSAIANGGILMEPQLVREVRSRDEHVVRRDLPRPVRRVVDQRTTASLLRPLMRVVSAEGTAEAAAVNGYPVAGKTGTTQKIVNGTYSRRHHVASFVGFAPADDPRICVLVVLDEPRTSMYGGLTAAPIFREIVYRTLRYLGVAPRQPDMRLAMGPPESMR